MRVQESQGDLAGAFETLRIAKELKTSHFVFLILRRTVDLHEIRLALRTGDIALAARLIDALQPGTSQIVSLREQELVLLARLGLAQGRPGEAAAIRSPLAQEAENGERNGALLEIRSLHACALEAQGEREAALEVLFKALALAEPEGFVRVFIDEGETMQRLLVEAAGQLALRTGPASISLGVYIAKLLEAFPTSLAEAPISHAPGMIDGLVEPLTAREQEVLQLIAAGDSNRTIAEELFITVSAVKKHTGNIFGKLNVNSRTQAVARARQLGMLNVDE
jgi:LuxR family maltose regulon positive regulatory protein